MVADAVAGDEDGVVAASLGDVDGVAEVDGVARVGAQGISARDVAVVVFGDCDVLGLAADQREQEHDDGRGQSVE